MVKTYTTAKLERILDLKLKKPFFNLESFNGHTDFLNEMIEYLPCIKEIIEEDQNITLDNRKFYISPGSNGSVEFSWESDNHHAFINISKNPKTTYYFKNKITERSSEHEITFH